ncbi:hypothetical protein [Paenochrobactrum glaciei]|uniref:Uncharacterized protein n=1 Tax=Paenochrobactrum glaciei TaxID=486407 RepID=A0ABN1FY91_9HYPH
MTLIAIWFREEMNALYAVADSRLTASGGTSVLTNSAPKFFLCRVRCLQESRVITDSEIIIGYAGSASVAFTTIATIQNCLSNLSVKSNDRPLTMMDIGQFSQKILEKSYRDFGAIWAQDARCDLVIFGCLPSENRLVSMHISCHIDNDIAHTKLSDLAIVEQGILCSYGSGANYFTSELKKEMESTGKCYPFNLITRILKNEERPDVGGHLQIAFATSECVQIPLIISEDDCGQKDVYYLGRGSLDLGKVGSHSIGTTAIG